MKIQWYIFCFTDTEGCVSEYFKYFTEFKYGKKTGLVK